MKNIFSMHLGVQGFYLLFFFLSVNFNNDVYVHLKKKKGVKVAFCSQGPFQFMPSVLRALVLHVTDATCNAV